MPALVNKRVGSFFITMGADGTMVCPFRFKKIKKMLSYLATGHHNRNNLWLLFGSLELYLYTKLLQKCSKGTPIQMFLSV